jgi:hypothetical protein
MRFIVSTSATGPQENAARQDVGQANRATSIARSGPREKASAGTFRHRRSMMQSVKQSGRDR